VATPEAVHVRYSELSLPSIKRDTLEPTARLHWETVSQTLPLRFVWFGPVLAQEAFGKWELTTPGMYVYSHNIPWDFTGIVSTVDLGYIGLMDDKVALRRHVTPMDWYSTVIKAGQYLNALWVAPKASKGKGIMNYLIAPDTRAVVNLITGYFETDAALSVTDGDMASADADIAKNFVLVDSNKPGGIISANYNLGGQIQNDLETRGSMKPYSNVELRGDCARCRTPIYGVPVYVNEGGQFYPIHPNCGETRLTGPNVSTSTTTTATVTTTAPNTASGVMGSVPMSTVNADGDFQ